MHPRFFLAYLFIILGLYPLYTNAETVDIVTGEYITEAGWGVLTLSKSNKQTLHFVIETVGSNVHVCNLEGDIKNHQAVLDADDSDKPCVINFLPKGENLEVSSVESESCRAFCGARAGFEGLYLKPPAGCTGKEISKTRKQFDHFYASKAYDKAATTLESLLQGCAKTLDWLDFGRISNDLAITQYHLSQFKKCQKTLAPIINASVAGTDEKLPKTEQELKELLLPSDFDNYLPIAKSTWHNWKLCTQQK
jgi:hypothetical protein